MSKIYTKTGDLGQTSLLGGERVIKSHFRICAYGDVDELNSVVGMACGLWKTSLGNEDCAPLQSTVFEVLGQIQHNLFVVGSLLACGDEKFLSHLPKLRAESIEQLELTIDKLNIEMPAIKKFILPNGQTAASAFHLCRTVCRRAERSVLAVSDGPKIDPVIIQYLNRLSDFLFVQARFVNFSQKTPDIFWEPEV